MKFGKIFEFFIEHPVRWVTAKKLIEYLGEETYKDCGHKETIDYYVELGYLRVRKAGSHVTHFSLDLRNDKIRNFLDIYIETQKAELHWLLLEGGEIVKR